MEALNRAQHAWSADSATTAVSESSATIAASESRYDEKCFRVLVSVDSEMGRRGICTMLQPIPEVCEIYACADLDEAVALIQDHRFNVLMVSASQNFEMLEKMAMIAGKNDVRIVVLLHSLDKDTTAALGDLSVDGFLLEEEVTEHSLQEGLASLARGEMAMPGRLARRLLSHIRTLQRAEAERPLLLTPREQQALGLLADGMSNKQIARRLGISEHGAKRHVANVLAKLNCPNRTLAVALALRYGLLRQDDTSNVQAGNALMGHTGSRPSGGAPPAAAWPPGRSQWSGSARGSERGPS